MGFKSFTRLSQSVIYTLFDGADVGVTEGNGVGDRDGLCVGTDDGDSDGDMVGAADGVCDGDDVVASV